jgi:hypothetical protein
VTKKTNPTPVLNWRNVSLNPGREDCIAWWGEYEIKKWKTSSGCWGASVALTSNPNRLLVEVDCPTERDVDAWAIAYLSQHNGRQNVARRAQTARADHGSLWDWGSNPKDGERSYWLVENAVRCGSYPAAKLPHETVEDSRTHLGRLLDMGVTAWVDLTEYGETPVGGNRLRPYQDVLIDLGHERGMRPVYVRRPIRDLGVPSRPQMVEILDTIDALRADGHVVYLHCAGGVGRTGTTAACWLIRHGMSPEQALATINERRTPMYNGYRRSPETAAQHHFVRAWRTGW